MRACRRAASRCRPAPLALTTRASQAPLASKDAKDVLLDTADPVKRWFDDRVEVKKDGVLTLTAAWEDFSGSSQVAVNKQNFKTRLSELVGRAPRDQVCSKHTGNRNLKNAWTEVALKMDSSGSDDDSG